MVKTFKRGELVFVKGENKKGAFISNNRDGKTATVEFITSFNRETGERTTKLERVDVSKITKYIDKRNKSVRKPLDIKIKYFDAELERIAKIEKGDWIDLRAAVDVELKKDEFTLIPLGVAMELPYGHEAHVVPRSSTFKNFGIIETNSMGIVDESYKGDSDQWFFPAYALRDTKISKGDRICQFRIMRKMPAINLVEVEELGNEDRGGHGSTGTK